MKFSVYVKFDELHDWLITHVGPSQLEPSLRKFTGEGWAIDVGKFMRYGYDRKWMEEYIVVINDEEKAVLFAMRFL